MSAETYNDDDFFVIPKPALIASVVLHLMIPASWLTFKALEFMGIEVFPKKTVTATYQEYVQVDLVGLPDVAIKDLEKLDPTLPEVDKVAEEEKPVEAEEDPEQMALEAAERKAKEEKALADKAKAKKAEEEKKQALKKLEEDQKRDAALKALMDKDGKKGRLKLKGNIVSQGTSVSGAIGTPKDQFTAILMAKVKAHFYIATFQDKKGLKNTVTIDLYPTGRVRSKKVVRGSGDSFYDSAVMQAIEAAEPFPIPEDLSLLNGGITMTFEAEAK